MDKKDVKKEMVGSDQAEESTLQPFNPSTVLQEESGPNSDIRPVDFSTSSDVVIKVENLWKEYRLGTINHGTLAKDLNSWWAKLRGKEDPNLRIDQVQKVSNDSTIQQINNSTGEAEDRFWALRDVSFDVKQGEVLGIIGKNGAGKSTLLKILSQVTTPTRGEINIRGRVASLLEVGTGFHPELTGRENIFLNGAILGMSKAEIRSKLDEIIAFAEIEKFIDTPVKRYSSGMYVRLAFAVAAHLEPEILIVDEVLAVGDMGFQKKCLGKMDEVSKEGRTILFVSHNMQALRALCSRGILLSNGKKTADNDVETAVSEYSRSLKSISFDASTSVNNEKLRRGIGRARFTDIRMESTDGESKQNFGRGETIRFVLKYKVFDEVPSLCGSIALRCAKTREIITTARHVLFDEKLSPGHEGEFIIELPNNSLRPREYPLYFWLGSKDFKPYDVVDDVIAPLVISTDLDETKLGYFASDVPGYFDISSTLVR